MAPAPGEVNGSKALEEGRAVLGRWEVGKGLGKWEGELEEEEQRLMIG